MIGIFSSIWKIIILFWLICFEKVVGLPLGFLALLGFWFGGDFVSQKNHSRFFLLRIAGLVIGTFLLGVVYNLSFFVSLVVISLNFLLYYLVKKIISSDKWRWFLTASFSAILVAIMAGYSWNVFIIFQLVGSLTIYLLIRFFVKKRDRSLL